MDLSSAAPTAVIIAPETAAEGSLVALDGTSSSDPDQDSETLIYHWDLDGDGVFGETGAQATFGDEVGSTPELSLAGVDGPAPWTIALRVTDNDGQSDQTTAEIAVENSAPMIDALEIGSWSASVALNLSFSDASGLDSHVVTIDWGDGDPQTLDLAPGSHTVEHSYTDGGVYPVVVSIADDDDGVVTSEVVQAFITGTRIRDGVLEVVGTSQNDQVILRVAGNQILAYSTFFVPRRLTFRSFDRAAINTIEVYGGDGNDALRAISNVTENLLLSGGEGNDYLLGGRGNDIIIGGGGNDTINGALGNNLLIGGDGRDSVYGHNGEDLLISGYTSYDDRRDALIAILDEWNASRSYEDRIENLRGNSSASGSFADRRNQVFFLVADGERRTVFDDNTLDRFRGAAGRDWYFANLDRDDQGAADLAMDKQADEIYDDLD